MALLSEQEILSSLQDLAGWSYADQAIENEFAFVDFVEAIDFVTDVAELAEEANHHPDIGISYNQVTITIWTHSEGGVTQKDVALATEIEVLKNDAY